MACRQWILLIIVISSSMIIHSASGQQLYDEKKAQLECSSTNSPDITYGYTCNGQKQTCQAYAIYRAQTCYQTLANISRLLNSDKSQMTQINKLSDTQLLDIDKSVIAPINCSCVGNHSQANTTHVVQSGDSYLIIANNTYQGLSTCQAMTQQNSVDSTNLRIGMSLRVPLRCACPTTAQVGQGFNYLMSYLVRKDVTLEAIALRYGATVHQLRDANNLTSSDDTLFPYTTVLVPLQKAPSNSPPPQPSKNIIIRRGGRRRSGLNSGQLVGVSVGTAAAVASVAAAAVCCVLFWRRRKTNGKSISEPRNTMLEGTRATTTPTAPPDEPRLKARGRQTLLQYELKELEAATENFNASNKIGHSVHRGVIDGTSVAVKKIQGDVSQQVGILQKLNHFNLVQLLGLCVTQSRSYLVFKYADNGSLADYLQSDSAVLSWRQRLDIALDVANGIRYLHNYVVPACVHRDIKSSNVLLDGNLRAKIANFGLAKSAGEGFAVTRHVVGTKGYMAPEYVAYGLVTPKLDVFSFGVVMLELLSGKPAAFPGHGDAHKEVMLWNTIGALVEGSNPEEKLQGFMDPALMNAYPLDMALAMAEMARTCVDEDLNHRPTIDEIQRALSTWQSASSPPSLEMDSTDSYLHCNSFNIIQRVLSRRGSGSYTKIK